MRNYRSNSGPFRERPFFSDQEIETTCFDALRSVDLMPGTPGAIRIERFIERYFAVTPSYQPLEDGVLGLTVFGKNGVKEVIVSSKIDEENSVASDRRIRSTFAHEGGHGLFHSHLFALGALEKPLFGDHSDPKKPKVLCRDEKASAGYNGQWWEFQANKAIGSLLMPKHLVESVLEEFMQSTGLLGFKTFDFTKEETAVRLLTETFDVNAAVARIRVQQLFQTQTSKQPML